METYDVFISYKSDERTEALHIKNYLQANGISCWMDQDQIKIGQDYEKVIASIMPNCKSIVLLLSYVSQQSNEVKIEYKLAKSKGKMVFPIKIKDCTLDEYYDKELRHTQVAKTYWKSEKEKQIVLCSIRDQIYDAKGEPRKTSIDFLKMRIEYYHENIQRIYDELKTNWNSIVMKSLERCAFMTPEPHYIKAITIDAILHYQDFVSIYVEDIINNSPDIRYFNSFCDFIIDRDIVTKAWISFYEFKQLAFQQLSYINNYDAPDEVNAFILRLYKDYLLTLSDTACNHPIVNLLEQLYERDRNKYELIISQLLNDHPPLYIVEATSALFIHPRYVGVEYINIGSEALIDNNRAIFKPKDVIKPHWSDFIRKFLCDVYVREIEINSGASGLTTFIMDNPFFTRDKRFNYMYLYLIRKLIEKGKPEYVKILLRNMGHFNWDMFILDKTEEITKLKKYFYCCMYENGYEKEYIRKLWVEA